MALNSRGAIDPRWIYHNRPVGYGLQLAQVEIYNQGTATQVYDAETNTWSGTKTILYTGPARVQPVNAVSEVQDSYNPTAIKTVRVQLPYNKNTADEASGEMPDIRPNDRMLVTSSPNAALSKFIYIVTDVLNSSNAWERTLVCRVDAELDPTEV